jgi:hypothetical protein
VLRHPLEAAREETAEHFAGTDTAGPHARYATLTAFGVATEIGDSHRLEAARSTPISGWLVALLGKHTVSGWG